MPVIAVGEQQMLVTTLPSPGQTKHPAENCTHKSPGLEVRDQIWDCRCGF